MSSAVNLCFWLYQFVEIFFFLRHKVSVRRGEIHTMAEVCYELERLLLVQELIEYKILVDWHVSVSLAQTPDINNVAQRFGLIMSYCKSNYYSFKTSNL